jgi:hypothetical protein
LSLRQNTAAYCFAAFASGPDDILIVTPSDHMEVVESIQEAIKKQLTVLS